MGRRLVLIPFLLWIPAFFACCQKVGPLEKSLHTAEEQFRDMQSAPGDTLDRTRAGAIFKALPPLLNEKAYTDPTDLAHRDPIMYRASLLMSGLLARLGRIETDPAARAKRMDASLQLYMNAYLLFPESALADLKALLPPGTDVTFYRKILVPPYETLRETKNQGHVSADVRPARQEEYYLMQMICGDVLKKSKTKYGSMETLDVNIERDGQIVATGRWDHEKDEIVLKLR